MFLDNLGVDLFLPIIMVIMKYGSVDMFCLHVYQIRPLFLVHNPLPIVEVNLAAIFIN